MTKKKTHEWFKSKLKKFGNDPEFLREYILMLEDEIKAMEIKGRRPPQCHQCGMIQPAYLICACGNSIGV